MSRTKEQSVWIIETWSPLREQWIALDCGVYWRKKEAANKLEKLNNKNYPCEIVESNSYRYRIAKYMRTKP